MMPAFLGIACCAAASFGNLVVADRGDCLMVAGPKVAVVFDGSAGWQIASFKLRDWAGWQELAGGPLGDLVVAAGPQTWRLSASRGPRPAVEKVRPDLVRVVVSRRPLRSRSAAPGPLEAEQVFTIFGEGAIFCDLRLWAGEGAVQRCWLEFPPRVGGLRPVRLHVKGWDMRFGSGPEYMPVGEALDAPAGAKVTHAGLMYGHGRGYCGAVEFILEHQRRLIGQGPPGFRLEPLQGGIKPFVWELYSGRAVRARATAAGARDGALWRWGIAAKSMPTRSVAIGQRIGHWQEGKEHLMAFPSDGAVEALALAGATVNVLHLYWSRGWGREHVPVDEAEMRRWVRACRRRGIRPVLYVVPVDKPGVDGINAAWYRRYRVGGLYFDFGAIGFNLARYRDSDYPAMRYVMLTRHYREVVGPTGLMIAHTSGQFPDVAFMLNLDAYLPGEVRHHARMLEDVDAAFYYSGQAYAVSHPWCEYAQWQTEHAAAVFCAVGAFPHVLFGRGTHEDNNYHRCIIKPARFVLPYWQILRLIPMDEATQMFTEAGPPVAECRPETAHWVVYRRRGLTLVTVSNLGEPADVELRLDANRLGMRGQWVVWRLDGKIGAPVRYLGEWNGGMLRLGRMGRDEYCGLLFVRSGDRAALAEAQRRIRCVEELRRQLANRRPPAAPRNLVAAAGPGFVRLSWSQPAGAAHVCEWRAWRSDRRAEVGAAEEELAFADYTAPPGRRLKWQVRAVDIAGNVGPAAAVEAEMPRGDLFCADFEAGLGGLNVVLGKFEPADGWLAAGAPYQPAPREGYTFAFAPRAARFVRLHFLGGFGIFDNAHVVEARVFDERGRQISVQRVFSSGDDPGHPAAAAVDGITEQARSSWWSDRRKGVPAWLCLDLGKAVRVAKVWVLTWVDGRRWYDLRVELSLDGRTWSEVARAPRPPQANLALGPEISAPTALYSVTVMLGEKRRIRHGMVLGYDDRSGYVVGLRRRGGIDGALFIGRLRADGQVSIMKSVPFSFSAHRPIPILIQARVRGRRVEAFGMGHKKLEAEVEEPIRGRVGLWCADGRVLFDNLQVYSISAEQKR